MGKQSSKQKSTPEPEDATAKERLAEAMRWLRQAEDDLAAAKDNIATKHFNWACYMSEQAGKKAIKAIYILRRQPVKRIHWLADLIAGDENRGIAGVPEMKALEETARQLDQMLTSTRYPDAVPGGDLPAQFFAEYEAEECVQWAQQIVDAVRTLLPTT